MEHKIINTGYYLLIVDDSEIKGKGFRLDLKRNSVGFIDDDIYYNERKYEFKKIIAHLPLNNSPILEGVDLLPPIEDEVEKLANEEFPDKSTLGWKDSFSPSERRGFRTGFNKAKEKYKYTEEDLRKAINLAYVSGGGGDTYQECKEFVSEQLESLQQPKMPVAFECETVCGNLGCMKMVLNGENSVCCGDNIKPKTTTNSQGLTQWVGEYIYG